MISDKMNSLKRKAEETGEGTGLPRPSKYLKATSSTPKAWTGPRPIITMMLGYGDKLKTPVRVLLDTGCDTPLIKSSLIDRLDIRCYLHDIPRKIKNANGEIIQGAGKKYTPALRLRHQNHYDKLVFEVAPLEPAADVFLPCWWIDEHPVSGSFLTPELCFDSPNCLKNCTREAASKFPLVLDDSIISDPEARIIGY